MILNNPKNGINGEVRELKNGETFSYTFTLNETHQLYCYLKGEVTLKCKREITSIAELNRILLLAIIN